MEKFSIYILIAAILHISEEFFYPGGFLKWIKKNLPGAGKRFNVKLAVIVNGLFLLLCAAGVLFAENYPEFALSIAGLVLVNGFLHIFSSVFTKSYSPGLITSLIFYLPVSIYIFASFSFSSAEVLIFVLYGILYHLAIPLFLFAPFNKPAADL